MSNGAAVESKQKEVLKVCNLDVDVSEELFLFAVANLFYCHTQVIVTEVLGGGKFYVQTIGDQKATSLQQQLAALNLQEVPLIGAFNPKKGDIVLAQFSADNSWNRAMVSVWNMPSFKIQ